MPASFETAPFEIAFEDAPLESALTAEEAVVAFYGGGGDAPLRLGAAAQRLDQATAGQVSRVLERAGGETGEVQSLAAPHGMKARALILIGTGSEPLDALGARKLGAAAAKALQAVKADRAIVRLEGIADDPAAAAALGAEAAYGLRLRAYRFDVRKSKIEGTPLAGARFAGVEAEAGRAAYAPLGAVAEGAVLTRDLVNEPANILYPKEFADRVSALSALGLSVEILGEEQLEKLGMRALLAVGRGSRRESHVAVIEWKGAADKSAAPLALVGKGVCFDTGGISLKPAAGMEEMTMDMGGAGVVAGVMKALALRKAPVNVVGILGLVENMPDGDAQRPGDVVEAMSGKTIEVINTDAEGRLVLADALWYVQERFKPKRVINLATLTGAVIVALGHEKAGLFSNSDDLAAALEKAAAAEGEGIWRLPLAPAYDKMIKSRIADIKNTGGRAAGSITAAQFLQRFIQDGVAWAHIDIAGVASTKEDGLVWPKGASGWGVATLVRLAETLEG